MLISRKDQVKEPFMDEGGERIFELIGRPKNLGGATRHSFGHVVLPSKASSRPHYHPFAEETYYILKGDGRMIVNGKDKKVRPGDAIFISPREIHQISASATEDLEYLVICAPAWEPTNSVLLGQEP